MISPCGLSRASHHAVIWLRALHNCQTCKVRQFVGCLGGNLSLFPHLCHCFGNTQHPELLKQVTAKHMYINDGCLTLACLPRHAFWHGCSTCARWTQRQPMWRQGPNRWAAWALHPLMAPLWGVHPSMPRLGSPSTIGRRSLKPRSGLRCYVCVLCAGIVWERRDCHKHFACHSAWGLCVRQEAGRSREAVSDGLACIEIQAQRSDHLV